MKSNILFKMKNLILFDLKTTRSLDTVEIIMRYLLALVWEYDISELYDTSDSTSKIFVIRSSLIWTKQFATNMKGNELRFIFFFNPEYIISW